MASKPCKGVRVLSIQSHTVSSRVGNAAATLPLQRLGVDVDQLHTACLATHAAYPHFAKLMPNPTEQALAHTIKALHLNEKLTDVSHILSGYIGSEPFASQLAEVISSTQKSHSCPGAETPLEYVCDPVLGDDGRLYVPAELVDVYKQQLLPIADVVLPNGYEAELLTDVSINSVGDAKLALDRLHTYKPHTAIITSMRSPDAPNAHLLVAASTVVDQAAGYPQQFVIELERKNVKCTGTGDMLSALLLGWRTVYPHQLVECVKRAVGGVQAAIAHSAALQSDNQAPARSDAEMWKRRELQVVQAQDEILEPPMDDLMVHPL